MSSTYEPICLDHNPPIRVEDGGLYSPHDLPPRPRGHENCRIAVGRYSGGLVEVWLPTPYLDRGGQHAGRWYDVSWMRGFPDFARAILDGNL